MNSEDIKLELGKTTCVKVSDKLVAFVTYRYDDLAPNPLGDDHFLGSIYSFNARHVNYVHPDELAERGYKGVVPLSYFEHGLCRWFVAGHADVVLPDFQWDGVTVAGAWVPPEQDGSPSEAERLERAKAACEVYTAWCNGNVYFWSVDVYEARYTEDGRLYDLVTDYRHQSPLAEDLCGDVYSDEHETRKEIARFLRTTLSEFDDDYKAAFRRALEHAKRRAQD